MKSNMEKLDHTLNCLSARVNEIEQKLTTLDTKQRTQEKEITDIKLSTSKAISDVNASNEVLCKETLLRWRKRKSVMVLGIPEASSGSVEDRKIADKTMIEKIANALDIPDLAPEEITRIGKIDSSKPRLIRFKCKSDKKRSLLFSKARLLKRTSDFSAVYIFPDQTRIQRQLGKTLQKELSLRKQSGENVMIKNGRVIERDLVEQNFR